MEKRTVWIVLEEDIDPYCGYWVRAVFDSEEKALKYVKENYTEDESFDVVVEKWPVK